MLKRLKNYFTKTEIILWAFSVSTITAAFLIFGKSDFLTFAASIVGVTAILLNAKGNPAAIIKKTE